MITYLTKHKRKVIVLLIFLCFFIFSLTIYADMEKWNVPADYKSLYQQGFFKYLENPTDEGMNHKGLGAFMYSLLRKFLWFIISILLMLVNVMETVFYKVTTSFNIFSLIFKNNTSFFGGLVVICLFIGIVVAGFRIANPFKEDGKDFLKLLLKGLATVVLLLSIAGFSFITMEKVTSTISTKIIKEDNKSTSLITSMVGKNIYDIEETFKKKKPVTVGEKNVEFIDIDKKIEDRDHDILGYKYKKVSNNEMQREKLTKHNDTVELNILKSNEFFYKYHFNFVILLVILGGLAGLYLLNTLKFVRNTFEMFVGFSVFLVSTIDITNQERLKANLNNIVGLFFNNIYLIASVFLATNFILIANTLLPSMTLNLGTLETSIIYITVYLALFWLMLDGAAIIQQVTGTDGGMRSGSQMVIATYAATKVLSGPAALAAKATLGKATAGLSATKDAKQALRREKAISKLQDKEKAKDQKKDETAKGNETLNKNEGLNKEENAAKENQTTNQQPHSDKVENVVNKEAKQASSPTSTPATNIMDKTNQRFENQSRNEKDNPFKEGR